MAENPAPFWELRRDTAVSSSLSDFGQNTWLVEEMYQQFIQDPDSVDPSWHDLLKNYKPSANGAESGSNANGNGSAPATASSNKPAPSKAPESKTAESKPVASKSAAKPAATKASSEGSASKQVTLDQTPTRPAARKSAPATLRNGATTGRSCIRYSPIRAV